MACYQETEINCLSSGKSSYAANSYKDNLAFKYQCLGKITLLTQHLPRVPEIPAISAFVSGAAPRLTVLYLYFSDMVYLFGTHEVCLV